MYLRDKNSLQSGAQSPRGSITRPAGWERTRERTKAERGARMRESSSSRIFRIL